MIRRWFVLASAAAVLSPALAEPAAAQVTQRVNLDSAGVQGNAGSNWAGTSISADGRYVAFSSFADNLVAGDTNGTWDVFVRDRWTGLTERASVDSAGEQGNTASGDEGRLSISADGRYVVFASIASNLVAGDTNGYQDVFVRDRQLGTTERVSIGSGGAQGNSDSGSSWVRLGLAISADGRYVAFVSQASNLVGGDTNSVEDTFVRDLVSGTTELVSVDSAGAQGNGPSGVRGLSISADGRFVAFESNATNLVPGDTNGVHDVFVRDRQLGTTERVSVRSTGAQGNSSSYYVSISADGRYVAFASDASNLVTGDTNGYTDIFVRDRQTATTERASLNSAGAQGNDWSIDPRISADGRYVAFEAHAANFVVGDTNGYNDVFVRDRVNGTTERASVDSAGVQGNRDSYYPSISADGRYVAFVSDAMNLVSGDTNIAPDVFVRDRSGGPSFTSLCDPGIGGVLGCPCANPPSGPGRGCENSATTGGAILSAEGGTFLSSDSLVFTTSGEKPTATSVLLQGTSSLTSGAVYGQGVRCVGGTLKRLFTKTASGGSVTAPNFSAGDPTVSARSAAVGNPIAAGESRWYLVFYRDPTVLGGCPSSSTFNATQTGEVSWSP